MPHHSPTFRIGQSYERRRFLHSSLVFIAVLLGAGLSPLSELRVRADAAERSPEVDQCYQPEQQTTFSRHDPSLRLNSRNQATEMVVGESRQIALIPPTVYFYPSQIQLTPDATYRFTASGCWWDAHYSASPLGWRKWLPPIVVSEVIARMPFHRLFLLCGSIGTSDRKIFAIGKGREWKAPKAAAMPPDRQLYLFPNDVKADWFYRNNRNDTKNPVHLTVQRLS